MMCGFGVVCGVLYGMWFVLWCMMRGGMVCCVVCDAWRFVDGVLWGGCAVVGVLCVVYDVVCCV